MGRVLLPQDAKGVTREVSPGKPNNELPERGRIDRVGEARRRKKGKTKVWGDKGGSVVAKKELVKKTYEDQGRGSCLRG